MNKYILVFIACLGYGSTEAASGSMELNLIYSNSESADKAWSLGKLATQLSADGAKYGSLTSPNGLYKYEFWIHNEPDGLGYEFNIEGGAFGSLGEATAEIIGNNGWEYKVMYESGESVYRLNIISVPPTEDMLPHVYNQKPSNGATISGTDDVFSWETTANDSVQVITEIYRLSPSEPRFSLVDMEASASGEWVPNTSLPNGEYFFSISSYNAYRSELQLVSSHISGPDVIDLPQSINFDYGFNYSTKFTVVPEPSIKTLMLVGGIGICAVFRKR